jgi:hypothetical protein
MTVFNKQRLEAAAWTFLQTFFATIGPSIAVVPLADWTALQGILISAAMASAAAMFSFLKSTLVRNVGDQNSTLISG